MKYNGLGSQEGPDRNINIHIEKSCVDIISMYISPEVLNINMCYILVLILIMLSYFQVLFSLILAGGCSMVSSSIDTLDNDDTDPDTEASDDSVPDQVLDLSGAEYDPDTGLQCVSDYDSVETVSHTSLLSCIHSVLLVCHITYTTQFRYMREEVCREEYTKKCVIMFTKQAREETVEHCYRPTTQCGSTEERCEDITETHCNTHYHPQRTECRPSTVRVCGTVCQDGQGEEQCHNKTVTTVVSVPEESCDLVPHKVCQGVYRLVPFLHPEQQCKQVPRDVCSYGPGKQELGEKQVITKWCYDPEDDISVRDEQEKDREGKSKDNSGKKSLNSFISNKNRIGDSIKAKENNQSLTIKMILRPKQQEERTARIILGSPEGKKTTIPIKKKKFSKVNLVELHSGTENGQERAALIDNIPKISVTESSNALEIDNQGMPSGSNNIQSKKIEKNLAAQGVLKMSQNDKGDTIGVPSSKEVTTINMKTMDNEALMNDKHSLAAHDIRNVKGIDVQDNHNNVESLIDNLNIPNDEIKGNLNEREGTHKPLIVEDNKYINMKSFVNKTPIFDKTRKGHSLLTKQNPNENTKISGISIQSKKKGIPVLTNNRKHSVKSSDRNILTKNNEKDMAIPSSKHGLAGSTETNNTIVQLHNGNNPVINDNSNIVVQTFNSHFPNIDDNGNINIKSSSKHSNWTIVESNNDKIVTNAMVKNLPNLSEKVFQPVGSNKPIEILNIKNHSQSENIIKLNTKSKIKIQEAKKQAAVNIRGQNLQSSSDNNPSLLQVLVKPKLPSHSHSQLLKTQSTISSTTKNQIKETNNNQQSENNHKVFKHVENIKNQLDMKLKLKSKQIERGPKNIVSPDVLSMKDTKIFSPSKELPQNTKSNKQLSFKGTIKGFKAPTMFYFGFKPLKHLRTTQLPTMMPSQTTGKFSPPTKYYYGFKPLLRNVSYSQP